MEYRIRRPSCTVCGAPLESQIQDLRGTTSVCQNGHETYVEALPADYQRPPVIQFEFTESDIVGEVPYKHRIEWVFPTITYAALNQMLAMFDPREWERRNWWKLPALWRREAARRE